MNSQDGPDDCLFSLDMSVEAPLHPALELVIRNYNKCPYLSNNEVKSAIDHIIGTLRLTLNERLKVNEIKNNSSKFYANGTNVHMLNSANASIMMSLSITLEKRLKLHGMNLTDVNKINLSFHFQNQTESHEYKTASNFTAPFSESGMYRINLGHHYWLFLNFSLILHFIKLAELHLNIATISSCLAYLRLAELVLWTKDSWGLDENDQTFVYLRYFIRLFGYSAINNCGNHKIWICQCIKEYHAINNEFEKKVCTLLKPFIGEKYISCDGDILVDLALGDPSNKFFSLPYSGFFNEISNSLVELNGAKYSFNISSYLKNVLCNGDLLEWDKDMIEDMVLAMYVIEKSECPLVRNSWNFGQDYINTLNSVHYICTFVKKSNYEKVFGHLQRLYLRLVYHYMKNSSFADRYRFYSFFSDQAQLKDEDCKETFDVIKLRELISVEFMRSRIWHENSKMIELQNEASYESVREYLDRLETLKSMSNTGYFSSIVTTPLVAMKHFIFKLPMMKKQRFKLRQRFSKIEEDFYETISKSSMAVLNASLIIFHSVSISKFKSSNDASCTNMYQMRLFRLLYISDIIQVYQDSNILRSEKSKSVSSDASRNTQSGPQHKCDLEKNTAENRVCDDLTTSFSTLLLKLMKSINSEGYDCRVTGPQISDHEKWARTISMNENMVSGTSYFFKWDDLWLQDIMIRVTELLSTSMKMSLFEGGRSGKAFFFEQFVDKVSRCCDCRHYEVSEHTLPNDGLKKSLIGLITIIMDSIKCETKKSTKKVKKLHLLETYPGVSNIQRLQEALDIANGMEKNLEVNFLQPEGMSRVRQYLDDIKVVLMTP